MIMIGNKQLALYEECVAFWQRMGVEKEDNLIALACLDVLNAFQDNTLPSYKIPYYIERGRALVEEINNPKYNENRGREGFLKDGGF